MKARTHILITAAVASAALLATDAASATIALRCSPTPKAAPASTVRFDESKNERGLLSVGVTTSCAGARAKAIAGRNTSGTGIAATRLGTDAAQRSPKASRPKATRPVDAQYPGGVPPSLLH